MDQSQDQSSLQPLRVGVVGLGWAGRTHAEAYQQQPNVSVVALAAHEEDRLASVGDALGIPHRYQHWEDLVARDDIDAVSVATPNFLHAPITIAALQSGKHVLCEKPLARSSGEAVAMVQAAAQAGRVLKVAFNHRQRGDVQLLKRYLTSGGLGEIYYAKARWLRRSGIPGLGSWFTSKELAGGGPLIDLGVHVLDMALYLLDEPRAVSVSATTYAKLGPRSRGGRGDLRPQVSDKFEVEDLATAFVRLADGGTLFLEASWATYREAGDDFGVQLFGTDGGAEINVKNYGWENTLRIYTDVSGVPADIHPHVGRGDGHLGVVREFVEIIRGGNWSAHTGLEGLYRVQIIDACYASALAGREVVLSESAPETPSS